MVFNILVSKQCGLKFTATLLVVKKLYTTVTRMTTSLRLFITHCMGIIFGYVVIQAALGGFSYFPTEADSLYYHLPLAQSYLEGSFVAADFGSNLHMYFPAATEALLAVMLSIGLPVGLFNVIGLLAVWSGCYLLGRASEMDESNSFLFACTIGTLYGVVRWVNAQTVDIWLAAYYVTVLALLLKTRRDWWYFIYIGILLGLVVGSKYSGPLFAVGLFVVWCHSWWQGLLQQVTSRFELLTKLVGAGITTVAIGGFWYIRNWLVTGNPVFPLDTPIFKGVSGNEIIATPIWKAYLLYPGQMIDGAVSEFMIWSVVATGLLAYALYIWWQSTLAPSKTAGIYWDSSLTKFCLLGIYNFGVFLLLPSGDSMQLHVSQYRLGYVFIIILILAFFKLVQHTKKLEQLLNLAVLSNLLVVTSFPYRPKIMIGLVVFYLIIRHFYSFSYIRSLIQNK